MRPILVQLMALLLLVCCNPPGGGAGHRLKWSPQVDSMLHDTVPLGLLTDSLRTLVNTAGSDSAALDHLADLSQQIRGGISRVLADEALEQSRRMGYGHGEADATCRQGIHELRSGSPQKADSLFQRSYDLVAGVQGQRAERIRAQALMWRGEVKRLRGDVEGALELYDSCLTLADRADDPFRTATCLGVMGAAHLMVGRMDSAQHELEEALALARSIHDRERIAFCLNSLGDIQRLRNNPTAAIALYNEALAISEALNDRFRMSYGYGALADLYKLGSDLPNALAMYNRQRALGHAMNDKRTIAASAFAIAECYKAMDETDKAMQHYRDGLRGASEMAMYTAMNACRIGIGAMHARQGRPDEALEEFAAALRIADSTGYASGSISSHLQIGDVHAKAGRLGEAMHHFGEAAALARATKERSLSLALQRMGLASLHLGRINDARRLGEEALLAEEAMGPRPMEMNEITSLLYRTYDTLHLPGPALAMHKLHVQWQDSLRLKQDKQRALAVDYDARERLLLAAHGKEQALAEQRTREQRRQKSQALIGIALVAVIALLLAWLLYSTRRKNAAIIAAQQQVVEAEKQRVNEQVRTRIARDIHDDIGSGLTKIVLLSSEAKRKMQHQAEELRATLDRITAHSREVSAALSDIVWSVDPAQDTSQELVGHAKALARRLLAETGVEHTLRFLHNEPGHPVAPGTKHNIVMVMKEAINNALKYAEAKHITVELEAGAHAFRLLVSDDGKGFDPGTMARTGNGLRNMRARAEAIGATLTMESAPGKGTTVTLEGAFA